MVQLLSSQATISLENARLYTQLERQNIALEHKVKELREAQDTAEHASMAKSIFLSTMSHEVSIIYLLLLMAMMSNMGQFDRFEHR
jgi:ABC-type transport system involved in cytochrome bd biosynthesis fused ATPase/permease subunit